MFRVLTRKSIVATAVAISAAATVAAGPADAAPKQPAFERCDRPFAANTKTYTTCVWDGAHPDGYARSHIVHPSGYVMYVSHRRAHRMLFETFTTARKADCPRCDW